MLTDPGCCCGQLTSTHNVGSSDVRLSQPKVRRSTALQSVGGSSAKQIAGYAILRQICLRVRLTERKEESPA